MNLELKPNDRKDLFAALVASAPPVQQSYYILNSFENTEESKVLTKAHQEAAAETMEQHRERYRNFLDGAVPSKAKLRAFEAKVPTPTDEDWQKLPTFEAIQKAKSAFMLDLMYRWPSIYAANVLRHAVTAFETESDA